MRPVSVLIILLALLASAPVAFASPIVGASANTIPQGEFMVDGWFTWRDYTWKYEDSRDGWESIASENSLTAGTLMPRLCYGVTDWLTLRAGMSFEDRYVEYVDPDDQRSSTGLGDFIIDPKIQIYRADEGYPRAALLLGVRIPTGDTESDVPLSDGSTDYLVGAAVTHKSDDLTGHVCVTHWLNGENEQGVDVKDLWVGSVTLETPIDEHWSLLWEAKGYAGSESSDYRRLYVCPGLSWNGARATVGISAMVSAYRAGDLAVNPLDFSWAPYVRCYYRFF